MILLSLVLVLLSLGLLIAGLAGASQALVWASILSSVVAGMCLAVAALQRRTGPDEIGEDESADAPAAGDGVATSSPASGARPAGTPAEPYATGPATGAGKSTAAQSPPAGRPAEPPTGAGDGQPTAGVAEVSEAVRAGSDEPATGDDVDAYPDPPDEPPEEDVSAPDALRVIDLDTDVYVVDGRPRYHLQDCPHLADREVVPLPVAEAREAGFTPCSLCKPDTRLAEQARTAPRPAEPAPGPAPAGSPPPSADTRK